MLNEHEDGVHIFNYMCDLTQFIVSCILIELTFVMVAVAVVDVDSWFRSTFEVIS